jgi:hypothetical protein
MRRTAVAVSAIALAASASLASASTASAAPSPRPAAGANQATFAYTGGPQDWPVPRGVQSAYITLVGAAGGAVLAQDDQGSTVPTAGGSGAQVTGTLALAPGTGAVDVWVGGSGGSIPLSTTGTPGAGGFNGGASGGAGDWSPGASLPGAGGGGATDLRIGGFLPDTRVMVAGGGGGAGGAHQNNSGQDYQSGGTGGAGGSGTASSGAFPAQAGGSATGDNPGAGGAGGVDSNGQGEVGGGGGAGTGNAGGGGGAGGWFGGAGGEAGQSGVLGYAAAGGGGGGGSSYADPTQVTNASATLAAPGAAASATFQWVSISTTELPTMRAGNPVSQQLSATFPDQAASITWQVTGGTLPSGLTLSSSGLLSGLPMRAELFSFTVSATAGPGALATSTVTFSGDVKSSSVPSVPTSVTAVGGVNAATASWVAPAFTGGTPLVNYQVRWSGDAGSTWSAPVSIPASQTSYTASLAGGISYVFQVAASNQTTTGLWSASSNSVAVTSTSSAPTNVTGTPGYEFVALAWSAPSQTGGASVTGYSIRYSTDGGGSWATMPNTGSTATTATVTNLTSQAGYIFEVAAVNSAGISPWSAPSAPVDPILDPNAPTDVVGTSAYQSVELTWLAPPNPSIPVTGYLVRYSDDSGATWSTPVPTGSTLTAYDYTGLIQPDYLVFQVAAVNANGTSAWSAQSAPVAAETRASAPAKLRPYPGDRAVLLTWDPPSDLGGGSLTGYRIDYRVSGSDQWKIHTSSTGTGATRYDVTRLSNGTAYDFRVAAITNTFGLGLFSQAVSASPFAAPGIPVNVRATAGDTTASLTWQAPSQDNGRRIVGYRIEAAAGTGWYLLDPDTGSSATAYTATGLVNGQTYLFRVAAINAGGTGEASAPSNAVSPSAALPSVPRHVTVKAGRAKAQVLWQPPIDPGASPVTHYRVESSVAGGPWSVQCMSKSTSCRIDGLSQTTPYRFRVAAVSESGRSPWTSPSHPVIPGPRPTPPTIEKVDVRGERTTLTVASTWFGSARLLWLDPAGFWREVRGGTITLPRGVSETRMRAEHRGMMSEESRIAVDLPRESAMKVTVVVDGDRSRITGPRGDRLEWRYDSDGSWRKVDDPLSLRSPWPPRPWSLQVRDRSSREVVRIAIR